MKARYVIMGCAVFLVLGLLGLIGGGLLWRWSVLKQVGTGPASLGKPGIRAGQGFLTKSVYMKDSRLGTITDIVAGKLDGKPGTDIGIAGDQAALILNKASSTSSIIPLSGRLDRVTVVDVENDGVCEFINRGSWGSVAALLDHSGKTLWTYRGTISADDMAAGDINGDGKLEFVVGFNGGGGVHLLDSKGKKLWQKDDGNVYHVEMVDANQDGRLEIVHSNAGWEITVRNENGDVLSRSRTASYFSGFSLCRWPDSRHRQYALQAANDAIYLFDYDGSTVARMTAPNCNYLWTAHGVPVKLKTGQPEYLAVVADARPGEGSVLYVYDSKGSMVYEEVLPSGNSITAIPTDKYGKEQILVGGNGIVWSYTAE